MDKKSFNIPADQDGKWGSYISKYPSDSGKVQQNMLTLGSRNFVTSMTGQLQKRFGGTIWNPNSLLSGAPLDQYEGIFPSGTRLLIENDAGTIKASAGNGLFTTIQAGFTNPANFEFSTYQGRVYGDNGIDAAIVIDTATSYGGVSYSFTLAKTKLMGAQPPVSAPTATLVVTSVVNQVPAGSHTYKITFGYYNGVEESNGGPASNVVVNDATHTATTLTSIPVGGYGVSSRRIYRDNNDGNWLLLDVILNNTATTYTDILPIGSTPTPIPTLNFGPPVFKYIALYLDRLFVIDSTGKTIAWSTAGEPDVFNPNNAISGPADDIMTAIVIYNGIPWVFGQHTVGTILGNTDGTFFYSPVSTKVGCVDNRSIQTREIISVPTLIWLAALPNKGLYYTNGSTVQYMSDFIEDLTFNLAQISYLQRTNTQNSQTAFQGGTATSSIDLLSNPGTIETINPVARYSHAADWAAGTLSNLAPMGDQLVVPTLFAPSLGAGSLTGQAIISGSNVTLPSGGTFSGESHGETSKANFFSQTLNTTYLCSKVAQPFTPTFTGTLNTVSSFDMNSFAFGSPSTVPVTVAVYSDSGGLPGSSLASQTFSRPVGSDAPLNIPTATLNVGLTGGTRYWIVLSLGTVVGQGQGYFTEAGQSATWSAGIPSYAQANGTIWAPFSPPGASAPPISLTGAYTYTTTLTSESGTWTSPVYDTKSTTISAGMSVLESGTYPASTTGNIQVQGSNDQSTWTTTDTITTPNGASGITGGVYRYWRFIITVSTTDNTSVPLMGTPILFFSTTGTWTSAPILLTTDATALDALVDSVSLPAGTTATITIATSALISSGYTAFTALGSAVVNKYAKIRVTLTTDSGNTTSPTLISAELDWTVVGSLTSSIIDTAANPPAGWGLFSYSQSGTTGTVAVYFRSASTSGGIPGATFVLVPNGTYPSSAPLEFAQWKVVETATVDNVPQVTSVTVNWLLTSGANVRAASLFFNKSYYLAVATQGSAFNNILIELDQEGNWRIHDGVTIGTFGTYFNDAFYGDSTVGKIYNAFNLPTDNGTAIAMTVRTKAFDVGDDLHLKTVRSLKVTGVNTGTTIHAYYSVNKGTTWVEMVNSSGALGYTTTGDLSKFVEYFIPLFDGVSSTSGRTILFRVDSLDTFPCQILRLTPTVYMRKGKAITEAMA